MPLYPENFDDDGFLKSPGIWSESVAAEIARSSGIEPLTKDHWRVLHYLRDHFLNCRSLPVERTVCREIGMDPHYMEKLFDKDLKCAWRIAGLPNPGEEARVYMGQRSTRETP